MNEYMDIFAVEMEEHLESLNNNLILFEKNKEDKNIIDEIFRSAHTIKGMSGTMGFDKTAKITHSMENLLDLIRKGKIKVNKEIIDVIFECLDKLEAINEQIKKTEKEGGIKIDGLQKKLKNIISNKEKNEAKKEQKEISDEDDNKNPKITVELTDSCQMKAVRAFMVKNRLENLDIKILNEDMKNILNGDFDKSFILEVSHIKHKPTIEDTLMGISEIKNITIENVEDYSEKTNTINNFKNTKEKSTEKITKSINQTVRVDITKLDDLMKLVSELIIVKTRIQSSKYIEKDSQLKESTEYLERITSDLNNKVLSSRMVSLERVFSRFPRVVRDVSNKVKKEIEFKTFGEDTELDRTIIDELGDPLIHIIRNSIDHGIEKPEERLKKNKNKTGEIIISAYQEGNAVYIECKDDGAGINVEKIKEKVIEKNLINPTELSVMSDTEILNLMFMPGFSTAEEITDISGRGVGLDVVKSTINGLGGTIRINTELNIGTTFTIKLPLTLSIIKALMINESGETFCLPLDNVESIIDLNQKKITKYLENESMIYRGSVVPLFKLNKLLKNKKNKKLEKQNIIMMKQENNTIGIIVDEIVGQQEIVVKALNENLNKSKFISGATILGSGMVSLILDLTQLKKD